MFHHRLTSIGIGGEIKRFSNRLTVEDFSGYGYVVSLINFQLPRPPVSSPKAGIELYFIVSGKVCSKG